MGNRHGFVSLSALLGRSALSLCGGLYPAMAGLFASLLLLAGPLLPQQAAHAGFGYAFSLIAVVGAAGFIGCLLVLASRRLPFRLGGLLEASPATRRASVRGEDWPLLVALLFGPFFVLLAGLGGWV